jgi:predicted ATP-grasp superfamily ATP-dependent carboligase
MESADTILILEAGARAAIEAIRSFLRNGLNVTAGSDRRFCAGFFVRGLQNRVIYPSLEAGPALFIEWLLGYIKTNPVKMILPLGDSCVELVAEFQNDIRKHTLLYMPAYKNFMVAHDKIKANKAAERVGVAVPRCWYPDEDGLDAVLKSADFPVLVKPAVGVGARGIVRADTPAELEKAWAGTDGSDRRFFIQELIALTGRQYVIDILLDSDLRTVASVASQKVRFYPVKAGASTLSRSLKNQQLSDISARLLGSMGYYGIANIDLIEDPRDGIAKFLEINPRFGEMHAICNAVGIDMPMLLYRLACGETLEPIEDYPEDIYLRFLPTDLMWFLNRPDRFRTEPGFFKSFNSNVRHTLVEGTDFGPAIGYLLENLALLADPKKFAYRFIR